MPSLAKSCLIQVGWEDRSHSPGEVLIIMRLHQGEKVAAYKVLYLCAYCAPLRHARLYSPVNSTRS